ncbi:MAG TPA: hypothetical protein VD962_05910 [Rubricoccaceae bacterium]|nr:hypothetical protein [Rubricoccaceae bacterium]
MRTADRRGRAGGGGSGIARATTPYLLASALVFAGCGRGPVDFTTAEAVPVRLDKPDEERLLRYYLGGYAAPEGADPFSAGLLSERDGFTLHPQRLPADQRAALQDADGDGALGWDELVAFVGPTYASARALPPTLDALRTSAPRPWAPGDTAWFMVEVEGSAMTAARRRLFVPVAALRDALGGYRARGDSLRYAAGTLIVGEHVEDGRVVETTVKRRRADGFWDFAVYDAGGRLAAATSTPPRPLRSPAQCVGCHLGRRRFDPEKSFPAAAPDGPYGPRALLVDDALRNAGATAFFAEHARRTDGVLGPYATLYTARLLADRAAGRLAPADAALLERLGL